MGCGHYDPGTTDAAPRQAGRMVASADLILNSECRELPTRGITLATCEKFGYSIGQHRGQPVQIAPYYDANNRLVAQKVRGAGKTFSWLGSPEDALPFGAHAWPKGGRKLVVTEGEIDALTMSQVQGNKYPVVSIASGAGPQVRKYIAKHREYFQGFDEVVLMFDMDDKGREAAAAAAEVIGSRVRIAEYGLKDANEMLLAGRAGELITAFWNAQPYRPEGIVDMHTLLDDVLNAPLRGLSLPFPAWDAYTYGVRLGELWAFGAGTGIGKTDLGTQIIEHFLSQHGVKFGVFSLEQKPRETATRLAGKIIRKPLHIPDAGWTDADVRAAWEHMSAGQVFLYDSFGVNEWDTIKSKIEYLYHAEGVQYFWLDHLTALVADADDERRALETIMASLGGLVKQIPIWIGFVSHLSTPEGKAHEEGGRVMVKHFKGSRSIGYWSHFMFGLERDQQADDEVVRSTTTFRCLKDRFTGRGTGKTFHLQFDQDTGLLYESSPPEVTQSFTREAPATPEGPSDF